MADKGWIFDAEGAADKAKINKESRLPGYHEYSLENKQGQETQAEQNGNGATTN